MPYIKMDQREEIIGGRMPNTAGELNFFLTACLLNYLNEHNQGKPNYDAFNEIIGVLECCKLEMYRKMVSVYEDKKIDENGELFPADAEFQSPEVETE